MKREQWLIVYSIGVGLPGVLWLIWNAQIPTIPWWHIVTFIILTLAIETVSVRVPPADPHTLGSVVILTVVLAVSPWLGACIAFIDAIIVGIAMARVDQRPATMYHLLWRPLARAGVRIIAIVSGAWVATFIPPIWDGLLRDSVQIIIYPTVIIAGRWVRISTQHGNDAAWQWWRQFATHIGRMEILPLPLALVGAAIYTKLSIVQFGIAGGAIFAMSIVMRQLTISLRTQKAFNNDLTIVNATIRAIINAELDVDALCRLIYSEASRVIDTSSFHLGIFEPNTDRYTLKVRVQDRQHMPILTVDVPEGDGIVGWMRNSRQSLIVFDFLKEMDRLPARPRYQSDNPPRSGIYVPLVYLDTVIGTISVQNAEPYAFTKSDKDLLSQIADQAAVAIVKARTFQSARDRARQLQALQDFSAHLSYPRDPDEVISEMLQLIRQYFGYHPIHYIAVSSEGRAVLRASTAEAPYYARMQELLTDTEHGIIRDVIRSRRYIISNDVHNDPKYLEDDPSTQSELAVPVRFGGEIVGVLDVQSTERWSFQETDQFVMQSLADQVGLALERARVFSAQREEAWRLNVLLQASDELNRAIAIDDLLQSAAKLPLRLLDCRRSCYLLWNHTEGTLTVNSTAGLSPNEEEQIIGHTYPEALFGLPLQSTDNVSLIEIPQDEDFGRAFTGKHILVLVTRGRTNTPGILLADFDIPERVFGDREKRLFNGLANQIGIAIENAQLEQEADHAALLEEEIRLARDIQTSLLPNTAPQISGWHIQAYWRAARVIGGDFYDYWPLKGPHGERKLGFVIADVSDKGMAAALFMTLSRSLVRAAALDGSDPAVALERANRWITRDSESGMFVTIFYGIIDVDHGIMRYSCAGHNPPLLVHADGTHRELKSGGIALGVIEEITLQSIEVQIHPGDMVVCYTDGVTESFDESDGQYGVERLAQVIRRNQHRDAEHIVTSIAEDVSAFSEGRIYDDVTLLVIQRDTITARRA